MSLLEVKDIYKEFAKKHGLSWSEEPFEIKN